MVSGRAVVAILLVAAFAFGLVSIGDGYASATTPSTVVVTSTVAGSTTTIVDTITSKGSTTTYTTTSPTTITTTVPTTVTSTFTTTANGQIVTSTTTQTTTATVTSTSSVTSTVTSTSPPTTVTTTQTITAPCYLYQQCATATVTITPTYVSCTTIYGQQACATTTVTSTQTLTSFITTVLAPSTTTVLGVPPIGQLFVFVYAATGGVWGSSTSPEPGVTVAVCTGAFAGTPGSGGGCTNYLPNGLTDQNGIASFNVPPGLIYQVVAVDSAGATQKTTGVMPNNVGAAVVFTFTYYLSLFRLSSLSLIGGLLGPVVGGSFTGAAEMLFGVIVAIASAGGGIWLEKSKGL